MNIEDYVAAKPIIGYGVRPQAFRFKSKKFEKPGRYFHPLLGTLITGAARLMLALAEHQVLEQRLDWAFCDTDSIAIANTCRLPPDEFDKALLVRDWFTDLNPYGEETSILQLEKVNFPKGKDGDLEALDPPNCLTVSAKRYVLFNRQGGSPMIRKASGHGLGHLLAPYDEPAAERRARIERIGVPLWQEDRWKEIIRAAETDAPDHTKFMDMPGFDAPAASQYAATTPELLAWFQGLQCAPATPYFKRAIDAKDHAFDRERDQPVPASWLKSHGRSLVRYHLHPETKFWGGEYDRRGSLRRRHVFALTHLSIGKEADQIEESEYIGEEGCRGGLCPKCG